MMKRDLRIGPDGEPILVNMSTERNLEEWELNRYKRLPPESPSVDLPPEPLRSVSTERRGIMRFVQNMASILKKLK